MPYVGMHVSAKYRGEQGRRGENYGQGQGDDKDRGGAHLEMEKAYIPILITDYTDKSSKYLNSGIPRKKKDRPRQLLRT